MPADSYEAVIGLEVHTELSTVTKLFCGCPNQFGDEPNTNVCPVCLGLPGSLPVLNAAVVDYALRLAAALSFRVPDRSIFARKNYFYPDMPKNFQISQYDEPLCVDGWLDVTIDDPDGPSVHVDLQVPVRAQRLVVLGDLEVLRHVRVEVVLPGEPAPLRDRAVQREPDPDRVLDRRPARHRQ